MTYRKKFASREEFESVVKNCENTCVVIFSASWCGPCQVCIIFDSSFDRLFLLGKTYVIIDYATTF